MDYNQHENIKNFFQYHKMYWQSTCGGSFSFILCHCQNNLKKYDLPSCIIQNFLSTAFWGNNPLLFNRFDFIVKKLLTAMTGRVEKPEELTVLFKFYQVQLSVQESLFG